jgi:predicted helicase
MFSYKDKSLKVVFSTYQSIDVIAKAQKEIGFEFDLVICDEAHRTTGVTYANEDESAFVKVHDNSVIKSSKRLYMTATPRLYSEDSKDKALQANIAVSSMDDESKYGKEIHRIGFGEAVEAKLLADYKVLILTMSESEVPDAVQKALAQEDSEISTDDASKLIGCINALSKHIIGDGGTLDGGSTQDIMRKAVAFCPKIVDSKKITEDFNEIGEVYKEKSPEEKQKSLALAKSKHIDGTMDATKRDELMSWLKADAEDPNESRILTNVRCLSEGIDVPSLDAVMFLSARNSQVDVVQSVGRVMRTSPGKDYGYIIIPVVIPDGVKPEIALNDNKRYAVVWTVLNALRAHDDRFNATVNKIEMNKKRPSQIIVGAADHSGQGDESSDSTVIDAPQPKQTAMFRDLQNAIYAKLVEKVGDREYWGPGWAKEVQAIVQHQIARITELAESDGEHQKLFAEFLVALRKNINPSIDEAQAIEMLAQHIITKPVFEALFEGYSFAQTNAVSQSMQKMTDHLEAIDETEDTSALDKFYAYIRRRAEGIDNSEAKQKIIVELYDSFFKIAFPKMVEQLGIVYTPTEVVDFIIHSVNDVLKKEFGRSISDENVNILDPFTGTGTFITRLLQSGLIDKKDLKRKYEKEIFANEIVLLAYYIAAVNIENAYHDIMKTEKYDSFEGIVLTDTFQLSESEDNQLFSEALAENSERLERQQKSPLRVIIGNPPYSVGQASANDNAQNQKYSKLDSRIEETYANDSTAVLKNSLYDSYVKAFRWSSDRLSDEGGVVAFVSNGAWIDGNSQDGFRKSLETEFDSIYVFNLRGNQRTSGELSRKEGGKIFGSGSRTPISITLLVKNSNAPKEKAEIHYHDIGDYLSRDDKLKAISKLKSASNPNMIWEILEPNSHGDWLSKRSDLFLSLIELEPYKKHEQSKTVFITNSNGLKSQRDAWCFNSSKKYLKQNIRKTIKYYNDQRLLINEGFIDKVNVDPLKGNWTRDWRRSLSKNNEIREDENEYRTSSYRPFFKQYNYFTDELNEERSQIPKYFKEKEMQNRIICTSGKGANKPFSVLMTDVFPEMQIISNSQCFPLNYYEEKTNQTSLLKNEGDNFEKKEAVSDWILEQAINKYLDKTVTKEDIFYYVYGLLHCSSYLEQFANDLRKMLPRIPLVESKDDFWVFSKAGRQLGDLHVNYEDVPAYPNVKISNPKSKNFKVKKMKFIKKGQQDTIIYNDEIAIGNIPEKAYEYIVNGKSAIEWIIDRYQVKTDKKSGIKNDPNDWAKEVGNKRYILDLLLSVINLSVKTVDIVNSLPKLSFEETKEES